MAWVVIFKSNGEQDTSSKKPTLLIMSEENQALWVQLFQRMLENGREAPKEMGAVDKISSGKTIVQLLTRGSDVSDQNDENRPKETSLKRDQETGLRA
ncbi:hypothetical protein SeLEV6574_g04244 [Synchytrium endobioticum]|uniref:Uncharacterized protein n=1 Tax=Synchytrium endobioticum TaxID=286115 RepID=A0A507D068_9FUNG|nr:hypothetical protein SeLEV6574_g04244 [Synchytrium endobioticum]